MRAPITSRLLVPDYTRLRDLVSHRVTFDFDSGARLVGYVSGVLPQTGPIQVMRMSRVDLYDANGKVLEHHAELSFIPNVMTGFRVTEGPQGA
ncbi:MAG: hypothetical protein IT370_02650 [Deltaproteobacteria bacterium]|nr:hypothetical protein [Deltaproteobacteria bacterium]